MTQWDVWEESVMELRRISGALNKSQRNNINTQESEEDGLLSPSRFKKWLLWLGREAGVEAH